MSTIFGLFRRNGEPIVQVDIKQMFDVMDHWQADNKGMYIDNDVAFGNLLLHNTPESLHEKLPFENDAFCITADARIDNREEILLILKEFDQISESSPDSLLILYLYDKFGENCLKYLEGDFAFVILDKKSREIFCARDQMGVKPFFYYLDDNLFVFSSEKKGILSINEVDKNINEKFLLQVMAEIEPPLDETFHKNIYSLLPANQIKVTKHTSNISAYWSLELPPLLKFKTAEEYIQAFRLELQRAVKVRLRSVFPVGAQLSGGLDSSAITGLAASTISEPGNLYTFSYTLPMSEDGKKEYEDEEEYIDEVNKFNGIVHSIKVRSSEWSDFLEPHRIVIDVQNGIEFYNSWWQEPLRKAAAEKSVRVLLSGFPGDEGVSNRGSFYFHDLIYEGEYTDFLKIAFKKKQYSLPLRKVIRKLVPQQLTTFFRRKELERFVRYSFLINKEMDRNLWKEFSIKELEKRIFPDHKGKIIRGVTRNHTAQRMQWETSFGIKHKIETRFPLADIRLIKFFLSLPAGLMGHPNIDRYIFRKGLEGYMPESIRWRFDKKRAPFIFYWIENRFYSKLLYDWLIQQKEVSNNSPIKHLDLDLLIRSYDKNNPDNYKNGVFTPGRHFQMELLLYYFGRNM